MRKTKSKKNKTTKPHRDLTKEAQKLRGVALQKATKQEVLQVYNALYKAAQKRKTDTIRYLKKKNLPLPSILSEGSIYLKSFKKLSEKKTIGYIKSEYKRMTSFLTDLTSTVTGTKETIGKFIKRVSETAINDKRLEAEINQMDEATYNRFWKLYNEVDAAVRDKEAVFYSSTQIQEELYELVVQKNTDMSLDDLVNEIAQRLRGEYEASFDNSNEEDEDL